MKPEIQVELDPPEIPDKQVPLVRLARLVKPGKQDQPGQLAKQEILVPLVLAVKLALLVLRALRGKLAIRVALVLQEIVGRRDQPDRRAGLVKPEIRVGPGQQATQEKPGQLDRPAQRGEQD